MKFAHFAHVWDKQGMTPAQRYAQLWRELQLCDELGFDYGFCVEHHFNPKESWMSAPNLYTVGAGARTKRSASAAWAMSSRYISRCASPKSSRSPIKCRRPPRYRPRSRHLTALFEPFGVPFESRREVTLEFVLFLRAAFSDGPSFSFHGKYHNAKSQARGHPVQKPCPPLWIETRDPATLEFCAREGVNVGYFLISPREDCAPRYRNTWRTGKRPDKAQAQYRLFDRGLCR